MELAGQSREPEPRLHPAAGLVPGRTLLPRGWALAMPDVETQAATWQVGGLDEEEVEATGLFMRYQKLSH